MTLSRARFNRACQLYLESSGKGWSWNSNPLFPELGYLCRNVFIQTTRKSVADLELELEDDDDAVAMTPSPVLSCIQYVVYSPTFQVPAFYFRLHDYQGAPLLLDDMLRTSLFRLDLSSQWFERTSFALTVCDTPFPLLSQGDHPITGLPCWYIHPCETSKAVDEIVDELRRVDWSEEETLLQWMKAWFLVLETVIDLTI